MACQLDFSLKQLYCLTSVGGARADASHVGGGSYLFNGWFTHLHGTGAFGDRTDCDIEGVLGTIKAGGEFEEIIRESNKQSRFQVHRY